jgi:hypothetical protein
MNNIDKHRLLLVVAGGAIMGPNLPVGSSGLSQSESDKNRNIIISGIQKPPGPVRITKDGVELLRLEFTEPVPSDFGAQPKFAPQVIIEIPTISGLDKPVVEVLDRMSRKTKQVLNLFSGEF